MSKAPTYVYVLTEGDRHEGCNVVSVHTTFEGALAAASRLRIGKHGQPVNSKTDNPTTHSYDFLEIEEVPFDL